MKYARIVRRNGVEVYRVELGESSARHIADANKKVCPHRGLDVLHTLRCDICGNRGNQVPVYSCDIYGQCTHRIAQHGQQTREPVIGICMGCDNGPWPQ